MSKIRALRADEVECRVNTISENGYQLLLYKDARCDCRILDEIFGMYGWQDHYEVIDGTLYCTISIWDDEKKQWISKQNCGTQSNTEKEKGEASDAFKRACFNLGIGRELYTKIFIWISGGTKAGKNGKYELADKYQKFIIKEMAVDDKAEKITKLVITDKKDVVVFSYPTKQPSIAQKKADTKKADEINKEFDNTKVETASPEQVKAIQEACFAIGYEESKIKEAFHVKTLEGLTQVAAENALKKLRERADTA